MLKKLTIPGFTLALTGCGFSLPQRHPLPPPSSTLLQARPKSPMQKGSCSDIFQTPTQRNLKLFTNSRGVSLAVKAMKESVAM